MKKILFYLLSLIVSNTIWAQDTTKLQAYRQELESIKKAYQQSDTVYIKCQYTDKHYIPDACLDCLPAWEKSIDSCIQKLYDMILEQSLLTKKEKADINKMRKEWDKSKTFFTSGVSSFYYKLDEKYARSDIRDIHAIDRKRIYSNHFDILYRMLDESIYYEMEHIPVSKKKK